MKISTEFSKNASSYEDLNEIQNLVIEELLSCLKEKPQKILDLGCGSGALCKKITWKYKHFTGVDFAPGMLELHPKSKKIESVYGDFNDKTLFENLATYEYDHIFSASALQWAEDLEAVFQSIAELHTPYSLAIFTSGTFKTLNKTAKLRSLLKSAKELENSQKIYLADAKFYTKSYKLRFENVREMFRYIKRSGVSGSRAVLNYKQTKELMRSYPLEYLEFEVAFIHGHD